MSMTDPNESPNVRQLREALDRANEKLAAQEAQDAATNLVLRENALLKAGVNTATPLGAMFRDAYKGELTEDEIRAAAKEVGAYTDPGAPATTTTTVTTTDPEPTPDELAAAAERAALAATGTPAGTVEGDPVDEAYAGFHADLAAGKTRDQAAGNVIGRFIAEANAGNPDFRYTPEQWKAEQEAKASS